MPLLQLFLSAFFITTVFIALFIVAWYIALPLLILWAVMTFFYWIRARFIEHKLHKAANGCSIRIHPKKPSTSTIIDVDYTELDN